MTQVESVWDYPRPPRLESSASHLLVRHGGVTLAESRSALRVLETSHPPVYYLPPGDVHREWLRLSSARQTFCEFKGIARYWDLFLPTTGGTPVFAPGIAWSYPEPTERFLGIRDHFAFYPSRVEECWVDGEQVQAQPGDFYGGWITSRVQGPFKGGPGTRGW